MSRWTNEEDEAAWHVRQRVEEELERARQMYPTWPSDRIEQAAIVVEEAGEALKAALNLRPGDPHAVDVTVADYEKELVQTAAMALRALEGR